MSEKREVPSIDEILRTPAFPKVLHRAVSDEGMVDFLVLVGDMHMPMLQKKASELIKSTRYLAISHSYVRPEYRCESTR